MIRLKLRNNYHNYLEDIGKNAEFLLNQLKGVKQAECVTEVIPDWSETPQGSEYWSLIDDLFVTDSTFRNFESQLQKCASYVSCGNCQRTHIFRYIGRCGEEFDELQQAGWLIRESGELKCFDCKDEY